MNLVFRPAAGPAYLSTFDPARDDTARFRLEYTAWRAQLAGASPRGGPAHVTSGPRPHRLVGRRGEAVPGVAADALAHAGPAGHLSHAGHQVPALAAVGVHTATASIAAGLALLVHQKLGVEIVRRAWVNLDLVWGVLALALWPGLRG